MFAVIYRFTIKEGQQEIFEKAWRDLTILIAKHEGSLGSRLHEKSNLEYIAYAQWPDEETWKNSGGNLPLKANEVRKKMRESTLEIETLHTMQVKDDLLKTKN